MKDLATLEASLRFGVFYRFDDDDHEAADNWASMSAQKAELELLYDVLAFEVVKVRASTSGNDTANVTEPIQFDLLFEDGWDR